MNEYKDLISIVVPVYNVEAYLCNCIESIRNQTYCNIEVILVDDGSSDQSPIICDEYSKKDKRIKVIHQKNAGLSSARNAGINIAKGVYIGFVHSDDYIETTMFESLYKGITKYSCDIAICNYYVEERDKLLIEKPPMDQEVILDSKEATKLLLDGISIKSYAWDKLYKTELFHGIRYPVGLNDIDINTMLLLFDKAKQICQLQEFGYYYQRMDRNALNYNNTSRWLSILKRIHQKAKSLFKTKKEFDFSLKKGKEIRVFLFELPCLDNLGDHAIAYAEELFFERMSNDISVIQVIRVSGWDTIPAIEQLKKEVRANDVFVCQGGGNMGNIYRYLEVYRRKIMKAFPNHFILIFPQTIYFTKDKQGYIELKESKKIYNKCKNLTILARDQVSYGIMKREFQCTVMPMVDVVSSIDATGLSSKKRDGSILCLRSDIESALTKEDKKKLHKICEQFFTKNVITDTVTGFEIDVKNREDILKAKWSVFGRAELVITDRLHGMIFSFITATPCIILGNNHHKVRETYKTLAKSDYLYYVDSIEEVSAAIASITKKPVPTQKTNFNKEFEQLYNYILAKIGY